MSKQEVILCEKLESSLTHAIEKCPHDKLFILTDEHTHRLCLPQLQSIPALQDAAEIIIRAEDMHKNLETLASVWQALSEQGATRHSLLINLGGGMVTDLGGFAASTFKRGIAYINIPTTLLAMVDASVGGKTGINFNGLKNEIGVLRLRRNAETWSNQHSRTFNRIIIFRYGKHKLYCSQSNGRPFCSSERRYCRTRPPRTWYT